MTAVPDNAREWTSTKWTLMLLGVMALQVGLIFALGERKSPKPRVADVMRTLQLTGMRSEIQELHDPTLFTRPHARDFSAHRWLSVAVPSFPVFRWTEPARPLDLAVQQLGAGFIQFMRTNQFAASLLGARPAPEIFTHQLAEVSEAVPAQSTLSILGDLARRQLVNPPKLPAFAADDLLTNSVMRVQVDAAGRVFSAVLLGTAGQSGGSGSEADRTALELTRELQFAPRTGGSWLSNPVAELTHGWLIFQWRTLPTTNEATTNPKSP